jgi:hypothetical protein
MADYLRATEYLSGWAQFFGAMIALGLGFRIARIPLRHAEQSAKLAADRLSADVREALEMALLSLERAMILSASAGDREIYAFQRLGSISRSKGVLDVMLKRNIAVREIKVLVAVISQLDDAAVCVTKFRTVSTYRQPKLATALVEIYNIAKGATQDLPGGSL